MMGNLYNNKYFWFVIFILNISAVGIAYALQINFDLKPCFLCIIQRIACLIIALGAFIMFIKPKKSKTKSVGLFFTITGLITGIGAAIRHIYIQANPTISFSCGPSTDFILKNNSLMDAIPKLFKATGECQTIDWTFLGMTIPQQSLIFFIIIMLTIVGAKILCLKK